MSPAFVRCCMPLLVGLLLLAGRNEAASAAPVVQSVPREIAVCRCGAPSCCVAACRCARRSPAPLSSESVSRQREPADDWLELHVDHSHEAARFGATAVVGIAHSSSTRVSTTLRLLEVRLNV